MLNFAMSNDPFSGRESAKKFAKHIRTKDSFKITFWYRHVYIDICLR